jgi:mono/diheme cytochrome c family protein
MMTFHKQIFTPLMFVLMIMIILTGCQQQRPAAEKTAEPAMDQAAMVKRGEYLVSIAGCNDCHTPWKMGPKGPEPDMSRMLSGHPETVKLADPPKMTSGWMAAADNTFTAWAGPWGISYTAKLTPDQNTGLGIWEDAMFIKTIRDGRHMGNGRPLLPPMPWPVYRNMTDEDLKSVFAYLRTIPPVVNHVPDAVIAAPPPAQ